MPVGDPMKQHGFKFYNLRMSSVQERRLVLGFAIMIFTATILGAPYETRSAVAKDCHGQTPLPADVRLTAPNSKVPETVARFGGVWSGAWMDKEGHEVLCHTLVIEEVFSNGYTT